MKASPPSGGERGVKAPEEEVTCYPGGMTGRKDGGSQEADRGGVVTVSLSGGGRDIRRDSGQAWRQASLIQ